MDVINTWQDLVLLLLPRSAKHPFGKKNSPWWMVRSNQGELDVVVVVGGGGSILYSEGSRRRRVTTCAHPAGVLSGRRSWIDNGQLNEDYTSPDSSRATTREHLYRSVRIFQPTAIFPVFYYKLTSFSLSLYYAGSLTSSSRLAVLNIFCENIKKSDVYAGKYNLIFIRDPR